MTETSSSTTPTPVHLHITSHAHSPPLHPPPDLKFDLRKIPNPPKDVRDKYTGVDKRLKEWMRANEEFVGMLQRAEGEIRECVERAGERLIGEGASGGGCCGEEQGKQISGRDQVSGTDRHRDEEATFEEMDAGEDSHVEQSGDDDDETNDMDDHPNPNSLTVHVSVFCAAGKHRSVAFASDLAARPWPRHWTILLMHRDLLSSKISRKHTGRNTKGKRHTKGKWKGLTEEED